MLYENRSQKPISRAAFLRRVAAHFAVACVIIVGSIAIGMWGYHHFENLDPLDAFLNAAMLLGGMGPVNAPHSHGGKLFAGVYALYAGLIFLVSVAIVLAPALHRLMHKFHWDIEEES